MEQQRQKRIETKRILIEALGGACVNCGTEERLEFDHVLQEDKLFNIASRLTLSANRLFEELQKCQLLCTECHTEKTRSDYDVEIKHGTLSGYYASNCRCDKCKAKGAEYRKTHK